MCVRLVSRLSGREREKRGREGTGSGRSRKSRRKDQRFVHEDWLDTNIKRTQGKEKCRTRFIHVKLIVG